MLTGCQSSHIHRGPLQLIAATWPLGFVRLKWLVVLIGIIWRRTYFLEWQGLGEQIVEKRRYLQAEEPNRGRPSQLPRGVYRFTSGTSLLAFVCVFKKRTRVSIDMDQKCNNIYVSDCSSVFRNVRMLKNLLSLQIWQLLYSPSTAGVRPFAHSCKPGVPLSVAALHSVKRARNILQLSLGSWSRDLSKHWKYIFKMPDNILFPASDLWIDLKGKLGFRRRGCDQSQLHSCWREPCNTANCYCPQNEGLIFYAYCVYI